MICGFRWLTPHNPCTEGGTSNAHECISEDEHEEYTNARHFCGCGEKQACIRNEQSYSEPEPLLLDDSDDGVPF